MNIHEMHNWLAEDIDRQKLKADLRKPKGTINL
jgi:hypothetical protein